MIDVLIMEAGALFDYEDWLDVAEAGDILVYFVGCLATAREVELDEYDKTQASARKILGALQVTSSRIMSDQKQGLVSLSQRRIAEDVYEYRATRLRPDGQEPKRKRAEPEDVELILI
jgi:hypothetical protein